MNFQDKYIGIVGLGKSGYWSAKLAKSLDYNVFISDKNIEPNHPYVQDLEQLNVEVEVGKHSDKILDCDVIIKSPGISNKINLFKKISNHNIPVISEIEFASLLSNVDNICVTGTNGKTTTVSLIFDIISSELNILKSGNIGIPFSRVVLENKLYKKNKYDYCVLELSSFQLEHSYYLKKEISAILNISVDHMDRYDSFTQYLDTKMKIFENSNFCIYNFDDKQIKERFLSHNQNSFAFSLNKSHGNFYLDNNKIRSKNSNYSLDIKSRFEHFLTKDGIDFINDSKSTNIDSAIMALKSIDSNVILIMGGIPKEEDFSSILQFKNNIETIIAYGKAAKSIYDSLSKEINVIVIEGFKEAVNMSLKCANTGSTVLLSPACSSFDQFKNFEERGISFKNIVERFYA
jgi:UDP-N-acetylmuramoylalanine--D-glutamate ligase